MFSKSIFTARLAAAVALVCAQAATAQVIPPAGYIYSSQVLSTTTQNCIAVGKGGTFVAVGPGFTANAQAIVLVKESGDARLVAFGFNSIGDCIYDADEDVLFVSDNADAADGIGDVMKSALTGDTVFIVPSASTATARVATDLELLPSGSIEFASSLAFHASSDLLVGNASGGGTGTVLRIDGNSASSVFASGFDFTGGIAVDTAGNVFVAESLASFANQIRSLSTTGTPIATPLVGPSYDVGSTDLLVLDDGSLLASGVYGGDVVRIDPSGPTTSPFTSGLTFAGSMALNTFTDRVELLSSTFTGAAEDRSLHRFTPVASLVPGEGKDETECLQELYGIALVAPEPGKPAKKAICTDGTACDADGTVNGSCLFPVGFCFNVDDPRFLECGIDANLISVAIQSRPSDAAMAEVSSRIQSALPFTASTSQCVFSDGLRVATRGAKAGKASLSVMVESGDGRSDKDAYGFLCNPNLD